MSTSEGVQKQNAFAAFAAFRQEALDGIGEKRIPYPRPS
jgi:hypothetical protein